MLAGAGVVYPFVMTWLILMVTDKLVGLNVSEEDEEFGLDVREHGERGYDWAPPVPAMAAAAGRGTSVDGGHVVVEASD